jgi:hypothetical protein
VTTTSRSERWARTFAEAVAATKAPGPPSSIPAPSSSAPTKAPGQPESGHAAGRGRSSPALSSTVLVVDPRTGEVLDDLPDVPTDQMAATALELADRAQQLGQMRDVVEGELRARLEAQGRRLAVVGDYELAVRAGRSRVWDPDDLEATLGDLVDQGVLQAGEIAGLVSREPKVDGRQAQQLLGRLTGAAKDALAACFRWQDGKPKLTITPIAQLDPPSES